MHKTVVVSGIGAITSNGENFLEFSESLIKGVSGIKKIRNFSTEDLPFKYGGEIETISYSGFSKQELRRIDRATLLVMKAADESVKMSGINFESIDSHRCSIVMGATLGGMVSAGEYYRSLKEKKQIKASLLLDYPLYMPASHLSVKYKFTGQNIGISTACSSSNIAIGYAKDLIQSGAADIVMAGGGDPLSELTWAGFGSLRNVSPTYPQPFDKNRKGMVLGEGSGVLILEELSHCIQRGGTPLAIISGYGASSDAYHMTAPDITGKGPAQAILSALQDSCLDISDIDYINAHGTGTFHNDMVETRAIKRVFGERAYKIPVTSVKAMIGHTLGASGVLSIIASIVSLSRSTLIPTLNYETPDPHCDLDYVPNIARKQVVNHVLVNNFGFGGNNCSVIVSKFN